MKEDLKNFWLPLITATAFLIVLALNAPCCFGADVVPAEEIDSAWYLGYADGLGLKGDFCARCGIEEEKAEFYQPDELTAEILTTREGTIVEMFLGICVDGAGNGKILNTVTNYNYISYRGLNIQEGDIILSFCLHDPAGHGEDDIISREDYVIDTNQLIEG